MRNFYPYALPDKTPFHLETIPIFGTEERIDFFYKYKRATENLYIGEIDKSNLLLKDSSTTLNPILNYFIKKRFLNDDIINDVNERVFPKLCWLTDSFMKSGFKYPLSVHYNPRIQQNVIHPGSIRNHVIHLFHTIPTVKCLYFNTGGVEFDFMKSLKIFTDKELLKLKENIEIEIVADHGAIIPHINLDAVSVKPNILVWQNFIRRRLASQTFTIYSNIDIGIFAPWSTSEDEARIQIYVKDNTAWSDIVCKCAILAVIGKSYESDSLTVISKDSFETPA
jgi:hypothetical protein